MNLHDIEGARSGTLLELRDDRALTVRPKKDMALHAFAGTVWITQEGDSEDVILGPRETYIARGHGALVLSALRGSALVQVYEAETEAPPLKPTPQVVAAIQSYARALRRAQWSDMTRELTAWIARIVRRSRVALRA